MLFRNRAGATPPAPAAAAAPTGRARTEGSERVAALSGTLSNIGRDAAEVRGVIEDMQGAASKQAEAAQTLLQQLGDVERAQRAITQAVEQSRSAMDHARGSLRGAGLEVSGVVDTLREVSDAVGEITRIAMQTRLVAFNASVEAKRAGEAGRGFGVVADAVKDLANQVETSSKAITRTVSALDARIAAVSRELREGSTEAPGGAVHAAFLRVDGEFNHIGDAAQQSMQTCEALGGTVHVLEGEVKRTMQGLRTSLDCSDRFLGVSEQLIEQMAASGIDTADTPYIRAVQDGARRIASLFERVLQEGAISEPELFDTHYRAIAHSDPLQYLTASTGRVGPWLQPVIEPLSTLTDQVVACIAVDRNGHAPTHNRRYNQPQRRGDPVWNSANCRNRRIFDDRTGLAAARNQRPFLLQTYRRDASGGQYLIMKDVSAPIMVAGRHWGALRMSYRF